MQLMLPVVWTRFLGDRHLVPTFLSFFAPNATVAVVTARTSSLTMCMISLDTVLEMVLDAENAYWQVPLHPSEQPFYCCLLR